jgi:hypothetical protein
MSSICNAKKEPYTLILAHMKKSSEIKFFIKASSNLKMCLHLSLYFQTIIIIVIQRLVIIVSFEFL